MKSPRRPPGPRHEKAGLPCTTVPGGTQGTFQNQGRFQPNSKAVVVQICFENQDSSLLGMQLNE